ncbi:MAG: hypothetical protein HKP03_01310 [Xanthomonadales bacterium]|nr:hypothetical protein [Xanthomonadales bacterium]
MDECSGAPQLVMVNYGDSEIRIVPPVKDLARKDILRFRLVPDKKNSDEVNYNKTIVTIKGKTADDEWIDLSGSYDSTGGFMDVCVKPGLAKKTYRYFVEVPNVGKIDPRADVTR